MNLVAKCRRRPCRMSALLVVICPLVMLAGEEQLTTPPLLPPAAGGNGNRPAKVVALDSEEPVSHADPSSSGRRALNSDEEYRLFELFVETIDQVERNYVKKVDHKELMEAAIQGVINKLDPYSSYISPDEMAQFRMGVESQFGGIGLQVGVERELLKVISPLVGTPAYRAGLQAGDLLVEIEGQTTEGMSLDEAVRRLKGAAGTSVTLAVVHPGQAEKQVMTLQREIVHVETVTGTFRDSHDAWQYWLDPEQRIGYVRVNAFSRDTTQELKQALVDLQQHGQRALILDLRFNPGGLLSTAVEVSDLFIESGRIVSTEGRGAPTRVWDAQSEGTFSGFSMVVLVNRFSASASEIVAGCLQDHGRAVIVGERTWGKGSVQNVVELDEGRSALKLTTAAYHRPSGKNIHRYPDSKETDEWGVSPDAGYDVRLTDEEMIALMNARRQRDIVKPRGEMPNFDAAMRLQSLLSEDRQLQKAYDHLSRELSEAK